MKNGKGAKEKKERKERRKREKRKGEKQTDTYFYVSMSVFVAHRPC
jgi:hypothetical protein